MGPAGLLALDMPDLCQVEEVGSFGVVFVHGIAWRSLGSRAVGSGWGMDQPC